MRNCHFQMRLLFIQLSAVVWTISCMECSAQGPLAGHIYHHRGLHTASEQSGMEGFMVFMGVLILFLFTTFIRFEYVFPDTERIPFQ